MRNINQKDIFYALIIALSVVIVFSLGYFVSNLIEVQKPALVVEKTTDDLNYTQTGQNLQEGEVVASVNSDKFHYLFCSSADTIKDENKVYFDSAEEAMSAGLTLAGNCKI